MKRTVKILCGLLAILAVALSVGALLAVIGWPVGEARMQELITIIRRFPNALLAGFAALLIGALGVFALYGLFTEHMMRRTSATIGKNELGEASVSFSALETLADRTVKTHEEIRSSKTKVSAIGDRIRIEVRVVTSTAVSLIVLTHALQEEIAAHILEVCGVAVGSVDVTVDQTDEPEKPSRIN